MAYFPRSADEKSDQATHGHEFHEIVSAISKKRWESSSETDSNFMFTYTCEMVKENRFPVVFSSNNLYASDLNDPILGIKTYYEQQWLERGLTIKYVQFLMEKRIDFIEPDVEIEYDSYRSFGRSKVHGVQE